MDFELTDDRRMLAETLSRYLSEQYGIAHRNAVAYDAPYHDPAKWAELAELGILQALVSAEKGGFGGDGFDVATVFEALGAGLCPEPFLPALMAIRILGAAGEDLGPLMDGKVNFALAFGEVDGSCDLDEITTTGVERDGEWRLNGRKSVVYGGHMAERILVAAFTGQGLSVFEVAAGDVERTGYGLVDGGGAAEVFLEDTPARLILGDGAAAVQDALDFGALALCTEAVGAIEVSLATLQDYLKTRQQFGRAIGSFQALQHRVVDLLIELEQARSITILAASRMGSDGQSRTGSRTGSRTVSMAKSLVSRVAQLVAEETIQMHGGIAMTWEYPASHYAKRLVMIGHQLGDEDWHVMRVAAEYRAG